MSVTKLTYTVSTGEQKNEIDREQIINGVSFKTAKTKTETISSKTTTSKENGKTVTTTTTVAQFEGFDPERERKIADYAAQVYKKNLGSGKVKNEQLAYEKAMMEARTAFAQGKIK